MASASDHRAHAALQPADCLILLPQRLPAAVETSIGPAHYPAECTQSDAFLQPSLRARKGRANSNSLHGCRATGPVRRACSPVRCICRARSILRWLYGVKGSSFSVAAIRRPRKSLGLSNELGASAPHHADRHQSGGAAALRSQRRRFCRDRRDDPMTRSGRQRRDRADKPFNPSAARCFYRLA